MLAMVQVKAVKDEGDAARNKMKQELKERLEAAKLKQALDQRKREVVFLSLLLLLLLICICFPLHPNSKDGLKQSQQALSNVILNMFHNRFTFCFDITYLMFCLSSKDMYLLIHVY